jgi:uncharacterized oxidoreductase
MKMQGNTILITGGATGIGFSMAKYFHARGNTVIICGRREDKLEKAAKELPGIHTVKCDVANHADRKALLQYVGNHFPGINILINNAGIQRDVNLTKGMSDLEHGEDEIKINFEAPIYLSALFTPLLAGKENAAIVHVSSGLAFMTENMAARGMVWAPIYPATKAGIHAFSILQRAQLAPLGIRVIEVIPPMVESELNTEGRKKRGTITSPYMVSSDEYVEKIMAKMERDINEIRWEMPAGAPVTNSKGGN